MHLLPALPARPGPAHPAPPPRPPRPPRPAPPVSPQRPSRPGPARLDTPQRRGRARPTLRRGGIMPARAAVRAGAQAVQGALNPPPPSPPYCAVGAHLDLDVGVGAVPEVGRLLLLRHHPVCPHPPPAPPARPPAARTHAPVSAAPSPPGTSECRSRGGRPSLGRARGAGVPGADKRCRQANGVPARAERVGPALGAGTPFAWDGRPAPARPAPPHTPDPRLRHPRLAALAACRPAPRPTPRPRRRSAARPHPRAPLAAVLGDRPARGPPRAGSPPRRTATTPTRQRPGWTVASPSGGVRGGRGLRCGRRGLRRARGRHAGGTRAARGRHAGGGLHATPPSAAGRGVVGRRGGGGRG
jgi:hypothetical protein